MKLQCSHCNRTMTSDQELPRGQRVECPYCAKTFTVDTGTVVNAAPVPQSGVRSATISDRLSVILVGLLIVAAIVIVLIGVGQFNNPAAQSAIHQIYFALTTIAFLLGGIFVLLIALLIKR